MPLMMFNAVNQSFFMALFFWISGRVSSQALARIDTDPARDRWSFVKNKLLRLGLPSLLYTLVLEPATMVLGLRSGDGTTAREVLTVYFSDLDRIRGVVWYTANLLVFDIIAALFAKPSSNSKKLKDETSPKQDVESVSLPRWHQMAVRYGYVGVALANFLIRLWYPIGTTIRPTGLQFGFAAQYVFAYAMGFASPDVVPVLMGPFPGLTGSATTPGAHNSIVKTILVSLLLTPLPQLPQLFNSHRAELTDIAASGVLGGWNMAALLWSCWTEISFALIGPALMSQFYHKHMKPWTSHWIRPKDAYGAYLAHMLASGVVEKAVDWLLVPYKSTLAESGLWRAAAPVVLNSVVGAMNVVASFGAARVILDTFPSLRRIV